MEPFCSTFPAMYMCVVLWYLSIIIVKNINNNTGVVELDF